MRVCANSFDYVDITRVYICIGRAMHGEEANPITHAVPMKDSCVISQAIKRNSGICKVL